MATDTEPDTQPEPLAVTGREPADDLLRRDPLALLIGMLLDQQIPMEWAFVGPWRLAERLPRMAGTEFDAEAIATLEPEILEGVFREKPALHRYPAAMARRTQDLCRHLVDHYGGEASRIWTDAEDGASLYRNLRDLPGFGDEKSRIFIALLGKRFAITPPGWREAAGVFADEKKRSVADIDSPEALDEVRAHKKLLKAQGRDKQGRRTT